MVVYFDDLLISGATQADHDRRMSQVLSQFRMYSIRVGRKKCIFLQDQVQYLGYVASRDGIQLEESKVRFLLQLLYPIISYHCSRFLVW